MNNGDKLSRTAETDKTETMEDSGEQGTELCSHHNVILKSYKNYDNFGVLSLVQYGPVKYIEWKAAEVNVDSDTQDQEWAVVSTGRSSRHRSNSECIRAEPLRLNTVNLKSFKVSRHRHGQHLTFAKRDESRSFITFIFYQANADIFVKSLMGHLKIYRSKKDKNLYHLDEDDNQETQELRRSFAELNLFTETTPYGMWNFIGQFRQRPYETTMGAFCKITDALLYRPAEDDEDDENHVAELLNQSLNNFDDPVIANVSGEEYEVIGSHTTPVLPSRPLVTRGSPLSVDRWAQAMDAEGKVTDFAAIKKIVFHGGVSPTLRYEVWKFLLGYYPWNSTYAERMHLRKAKVEEYFKMKQQWKSMTPGQEERFSDFRDRKSLIDKDVKRTDRVLPFFAGDDNPNVEVLNSILMTYLMYNFDLGYVQGMSDLLSPILQLMSNEADTFWCFAGFMERVCTNFDMDQAGMKLQLQQLHTLLSVLDPQFTQYLDRHDSGNMFFCFRWLLVLFKREFSQEDIMRLWEVFWSDLPCPNFHLLFCAAILDSEKETLYANNSGFTEILKHVNELSMTINIDSTLCKAEGLYAQLLSIESNLPDAVRIIIGLEPLNATAGDSEDDDIEDDDGDASTHAEHDSSIETVTLGALGGEVAFDRGINLQYL
ncbi:TBC1 domain family member 15 [Thrips palmi]|uniref:TBC1 domain family member 15 n=1 Tax=Thrips palmi TaxID=161013 RepID=A0A6P8ZP56_THRPL|nr:TBC1 domain family member 15 [Thrips palmi]